MNKKEAAEQFEVVEDEQSSKEKVVYKGDYYTYNFDEKAKSKKILILIFSLLSIASCIPLFIYNSPVSRQYFYFFPLIVSVFPIYYILNVVYRLFANKPIREIEYRKYFKYFNIWCGVFMVIAGYLFIASLIYFLVNGNLIAYFYVEITDIAFFGISTANFFILNKINIVVKK